MTNRKDNVQEHTDKNGRSARNGRYSCDKSDKKTTLVSRKFKKDKILPDKVDPTNNSEEKDTRPVQVSESQNILKDKHDPVEYQNTFKNEHFSEGDQNTLRDKQNTNKYQSITRDEHGAVSLTIGEIPLEEKSVECDALLKETPSMKIIDIQSNDHNIQAVFDSSKNAAKTEKELAIDKMKEETRKKLKNKSIVQLMFEYAEDDRARAIRRMYRGIFIFTLPLQIYCIYSFLVFGFRLFVFDYEKPIIDYMIYDGRKPDYISFGVGFNDDSPISFSLRNMEIDVHSIQENNKFFHANVSIPDCQFRRGQRAFLESNARLGFLNGKTFFELMKAEKFQIQAKFDFVYKISSREISFKHKMTIELPFLQGKGRSPTFESVRLSDSSVFLVFDFSGMKFPKFIRIYLPSLNFKGRSGDEVFSVKMTSFLVKDGGFSEKIRIKVRNLQTTRNMNDNVEKYVFVERGRCINEIPTDLGAYSADKYSTYSKNDKMDDELDIGNFEVTEHHFCGNNFLRNLNLMANHKNLKDESGLLPPDLINFSIDSLSGENGVLNGFFENFKFPLPYFLPRHDGTYQYGKSIQDKVLNIFLMDHRLEIEMPVPFMPFWVPFRFIENVKLVYENEEHEFAHILVKQIERGRRMRLEIFIYDIESLLIHLKTTSSHILRIGQKMDPIRYMFRNFFIKFSYKSGLELSFIENSVSKQSVKNKIRLDHEIVMLEEVLKDSANPFSRVLGIFKKNFKKTQSVNGFCIETIGQNTHPTEMVDENVVAALNFISPQISIKLPFAEIFIDLKHFFIQLTTTGFVDLSITSQIIVLYDITRYSQNEDIFKNIIINGREINLWPILFSHRTKHSTFEYIFDNSNLDVFPNPKGYFNCLLMEKSYIKNKTSGLRLENHIKMKYNFVIVLYGLENNIPDYFATISIQRSLEKDDWNYFKKSHSNTISVNYTTGHYLSINHLLLELQINFIKFFQYFSDWNLFFALRKNFTPIEEFTKVILQDLLSNFNSERMKYSLRWPSQRSVAQQRRPKAFTEDTVKSDTFFNDLLDNYAFLDDMAVRVNSAMRRETISQNQRSDEKKESNKTQKDALKDKGTRSVNKDTHSDGAPNQTLDLSKIFANLDETYPDQSYDCPEERPPLKWDTLPELDAVVYPDTELVKIDFHLKCNLNKKHFAEQPGFRVRWNRFVTKIIEEDSSQSRFHLCIEPAQFQFPCITRRDLRFSNTVAPLIDIKVSLEVSLSYEIPYNFSNHLSNDHYKTVVDSGVFVPVLEPFQYVGLSDLTRDIFTRENTFLALDVENGVFFAAMFHAGPLYFLNNATLLSFLTLGYFYEMLNYLNYNLNIKYLFNKDIIIKGTLPFDIECLLSKKNPYLTSSIRHILHKQNIRLDDPHDRFSTYAKFSVLEHFPIENTDINLSYRGVFKALRNLWKSFAQKDISSDNLQESLIWYKYNIKRSKTIPTSTHTIHRFIMKKFPLQIYLVKTISFFLISDKNILLEIVISENDLCNKTPSLYVSCPIHDIYTANLLLERNGKIETQNASFSVCFSANSSAFLYLKFHLTMVSWVKRLITVLGLHKFIYCWIDYLVTQISGSVDKSKELSSLEFYEPDLKNLIRRYYLDDDTICLLKKLSEYITLQQEPSSIIVRYPKLPDT